MDINEHDIRTAFDTEGCLSPAHYPKRIVWDLEISNTDLHWLELVRDYLVAHGYHPHIYANTHPNRPKSRVVYNLFIYRNAEIARFLTDFPPLMAQKQQRASEFRLWLHRPKYLRDRSKSRSTIKAVEQMLKSSRRMI